MRALLSVYDKTGLEAFARGLVDLGCELVASGNTSQALAEAGIAHVTVESVTGSPEMFGGRVKTLHPRIHGGILANLDLEEHRADLAAQGIEPIGLVACNLYPFTSQPSIEMIDIGGPAMVRAAAKNHDRVTVIVVPSDYGAVLDELRREGEVSASTRRRLAREAFAHTATYDAAIVNWFDSSSAKPPAGDGADPLPRTIHLALERAQELRYGENPHQRSARYRALSGPDVGAGSSDPDASGGWFETAVQHGGRELSYLNLFDAEAAWRLAHEMLTLDGVGAAAAIVKHANPCGAAVEADSGDIATAYRRAFESDPLSAFGGIVALTGYVDLALAEQIVANPLADVLVARGYAEDALALLTSKRKNMRSLAAEPPTQPRLVLRQIDGGYLVQETDRLLAPRSEWRTVTKMVPSEDAWRDAELAWLVCARTSSNAIVLASRGQIVGVGCGQQNRVDAAGLAVRKAAGRAEGGAGASDAFFPFRDGLDAVADAGVSVVVQPGGSLRDDEVIAAADERNIAMVLTGERHFRH
ncbi:MAG: bifunctional phosphoribosylaminoimidazolecarboxamide formyltransferase/IMP cyclohydrolase [Acidimicrobiales bacterium]|jgi:phosphoribosylaminoimidazolecarboxamide formyltransferase/IMP cyclohydrolase